MIDPAKKVFSLVDEFKAFALKGSVIDLAVGVIIGAAFAKIVDSLVKNIIMPFIGLILPGEKGYESWKIVIGEGEAQKVIPYGAFIGDVVNFLLVAVALYIFIVKFLGIIMRNKKEVGPPPPTRDQELLTEIRDVLKAKQVA